MARRPEDIAELHLLIEELEDDRDRTHRREAVWASLAFHFAVIIAILLLPKVFPQWGKPVAVVQVSPEIKDEDIRYLDLAADALKKVPPPKTDIISDKNRIAQARNPSPDRHTLEELEMARRRGAPGMNAPAPRPQPPQQQAAAAQPAQPQPQAQPQQQQPVQQQPDANTIAKLQTPPQPRPIPRGAFNTNTSASQMIAEAARGAAAGRGGDAGDYGMGTINPNTALQGNIDVLSDTLGVDFGPYLQRVLQNVRENWYNLIPESARPPLLKQGKLAIEFVITKNGSVAQLRIVAPSGDVALDRAAYGGITASNPFQPLPKEFRGDYLALRFKFYYNPNKGQLN